VFLIVMILIQACERIPTQLAETTAAPVTPQPSASFMAIETTAQLSATRTITISATPSFTPSTTSTITPLPPTSTPTLTLCMQAGGRVEVYEISTVLLPNPLVYRIYLPPCYDEEPGQFYPVLYLIHGQTYTDTQWDRLGVPEVADKLIASGETVPFIVVMPRDRVWLEPPEDNFGKAVEQALIPWIDEHYRTMPDREHRAIGGLSRGGAWAVHIGFLRSDLFSAVGIHSGFVFYSDSQPLYLWLYQTPEDMLPRIYMDVGAEDRPEIINGGAWLENLLTRLDIPHEWHLFSGEHVEAYWQAHVEDYLRWYAMDW
jgi:enterochelin esterase-like enzyme